MDARGLLDERRRQPYPAAPARKRLRKSVIEAPTRFDGGPWLAVLKDSADHKVHGLNVREAMPEDPRRVTDPLPLAAMRHRPFPHGRGPGDYCL